MGIRKGVFVPVTLKEILNIGIKFGEWNEYTPKGKLRIVAHDEKTAVLECRENGQAWRQCLPRPPSIADAVCCMNLMKLLKGKLKEQSEAETPPRHETEAPTECPVCGSKIKSDAIDIWCADKRCTWIVPRRPDYEIKCWNCDKNFEFRRWEDIHCPWCGSRMEWWQFEAARKAMHVSEKTEGKWGGDNTRT